MKPVDRIDITFASIFNNQYLGRYNFFFMHRPKHRFLETNCVTVAKKTWDGRWNTKVTWWRGILITQPPHHIPVLTNIRTPYMGVGEMKMATSSTKWRLYVDLWSVHHTLGEGNSSVPSVLKINYCIWSHSSRHRCQYEWMQVHVFRVCHVCMCLCIWIWYIFT